MNAVSNFHYVLIHGTGGSPESNWLPWLKSELEKRGAKVLTPTLPTPEGQTLDGWRNAFHEQVGPLTKEMVLVGHSMGVGFILRLLERTDIAVEATFLIAGWQGPLNLPEFDPLIDSFFTEPFDFTQIQMNLGICRMYHGDNDPYVPLKMAESLAEEIGVELRVVENGGHLNSESGFETFPLLLENLVKLPTSVSPS